MRTDQCELCGNTVTPVNECTCHDCGKRTCEACGRTDVRNKGLSAKEREVWQCNECEFSS